MITEKAVLPSVGLTTEQLAVVISYHNESIRRAIRQGRIKAIQFGNTWRIPPDEVARILKEGLPVPNSRLNPRNKNNA